MLNITPDTWPFFYCAFERSVRTLRISIAVRIVVDLRSPDPMAKRQLTIAEVFAASKKCMCINHTSETIKNSFCSEESRVHS